MDSFPLVIMDVAVVSSKFHLGHALMEPINHVPPVPVAPLFPQDGQRHAGLRSGTTTSGGFSGIAGQHSRAHSAVQRIAVQYQRILTQDVATLVLQDWRQSMLDPILLRYPVREDWLGTLQRCLCAREVVRGTRTRRLSEVV
ncbi:hypothetical protein ACJZ2D_004178 [Fusarium nematophilum]